MAEPNGSSTSAFCFHCKLPKLDTCVDRLIRSGTHADAFMSWGSFFICPQLKAHEASSMLTQLTPIEPVPPVPNRSEVEKALLTTPDE